MPAVVEETHFSRSQNGKTGSRTYVIKGAEDELAARTALLADTPIALNGQRRQDADCGVDEIGVELWIGTVSYALPGITGKQEQNTFNISFDISGQTQRITQSRRTVSKKARSGSFVRDFKGAINVSGSGSDTTVDGCDISIPAISYQVTYTFPANIFNDGTYIRKLIRGVGSVNTDDFKGSLAGELLLIRVSGQKNSEGKWDITFGFAVSLNEEGLSVGDIEGIDKKGWEYLWVHYGDEEATDEGVTYVSKVPTQVNIEEVYRKTSYADLGLDPVEGEE